MSYRIVKIVGADKVPDWERRPPKWKDLADQVMALEPNQSLEVEFDDPDVAKRARDAVRLLANAEAKELAVRTRLVNNDDNTSTLFLILVTPEQRIPQK